MAEAPRFDGWNWIYPPKPIKKKRTHVKIMKPRIEDEDDSDIPDWLGTDWATKTKEEMAAYQASLGKSRLARTRGPPSGLSKIEYCRKYYAENREVLLEKQRERRKNQPRVSETDYLELCECGNEVMHRGMSAHKKSQKHKDIMEDINEIGLIEGENEKDVGEEQVADEIDP